MKSTWHTREQCSWVFEVVVLGIPFKWYFITNCVWVTSHLARTKYWVGEDVDFDSSDLTNPFEQSNSMSWLRIQLLSNQRSLGVLGPRITDNSQISLFISSNDCPRESQICFFRVFSSLMNCCVKSDIHEHSPNNHIHIRNIVQDRLCDFQIFLVVEKTDSMQCDVSDDDKVVPISLPHSFDFPRQLKLTLCARGFLAKATQFLFVIPSSTRRIVGVFWIFFFLIRRVSALLFHQAVKEYFFDSGNSWNLVDGSTSFKTTITSTCCRIRACTIVPKAGHFGHLNFANHRVLIEESESQIRLRTQLGNTVDILIPVQIKTFSSTQEPSVVPRAD